MKRTLCTLALLTAGAAFAQANPVGLWKTIDDETKAEKSYVRVVEAGGVFTAKVEKILDPAKADAKCDKCSDDRKDKPMLGLEIIRGAKKAEGKDVWEDGKILDPESGRNYSLRLTPIEGGAKLEVRGSIAFIGRTQTWVRVSAQP